MWPNPEMWPNDVVLDFVSHLVKKFLIENFIFYAVVVELCDRQSKDKFLVLAARNHFFFFHVTPNLGKNFAIGPKF